MKRLILFLGIGIVILSGCQGCAQFQAQINKIPLAEFDSFEYHRGGNVTSATITASGARIVDGKLSIKDISITEDWGPAFSLHVGIKGYKRPVPNYQPPEALIPEVQTVPDAGPSSKDAK